MQSAADPHWLQPPPLLLLLPSCCLCCCLLLVCLDSAGTTQATSAAGSNETDLLAGWCPAGHSGGVTNVLVVTTTVGMLHGVHAHTTHLQGGDRNARAESELESAPQLLLPHCECSLST